MKQFFALAALFAVLGVSAQEKQIQEPKKQKYSHEQMASKHGEMHKRGDKKQGEKRQKPSVDQQVAQFSQYGLTDSQQKEVKSLLESRDKQMKKDFDKREKEMTKSKENFEKEQQKFDKKLEKILDQEQYAKFKEDHQKRFQGKDKGQKKDKSEHKGGRRMHKVDISK